MSLHQGIAVFAAAISTLLLMPSPVRAVDVHLAWDAPTTTDGTPAQALAGYKLYYGPASRLYDRVIDVGNRTTYTVSGLQAGHRYYFSVVAYDHARQESPFAEEVSTLTVSNPVVDASERASDERPNGDEVVDLVDPEREDDYLAEDVEDAEDSAPSDPTEPPPLAANDWTNYWVTLTLRPTDEGAVGVMFRYQDPENYYRFSWRSDGASGRLIKRYHGDFTLLAEQAIPHAPGWPYRLDIVADGETLEVALEGMPLLSAVDADLSEGAVGLYTWFNAGSAFDDVVVQDLDTQAVLVWDDFTHADLTSWTIVDEGTWPAPSAWAVADGALCQRSKIYSEVTDPADLADYGTYALYLR